MRREVKIIDFEETRDFVSKRTGETSYVTPIVVGWEEVINNGEPQMCKLLIDVRKKIDTEKLRAYKGTEQKINISFFLDVREYEKEGKTLHYNQINGFLPSEFYIKS